MKYVEVFELMKKRDSRVLEDKELFRKSQLIDKVINLVISEKIASENRIRRMLSEKQNSAYEDDKRYAELYEIEKEVCRVAKLLDEVDAIVKSKFQ